MKWIEIQTFKLYYDKKYYLQCLYVKNINSRDKSSIFIYSQCFYTNLATSLPFLVDLSNNLKINIITYEYTNKNKEQSNYYDINILYNYLYRIEFIKSIILLGFSTGNIINMNIMSSKINSKFISKIKAYIFISPTWVYDTTNLKKSKNDNNTKGVLSTFFDGINQLNIPVFIIHGQKDKKIKYFLSISFSQKINNKYEWYPKNGTHLNIINDYRRKLLIKIKEFLSNYLLNNDNFQFDIFSKLEGEEINNDNNNKEERATPLFNEEKKSQNKFGEINTIKNSNNIDKTHKSGHTKIKSELNMSLNKSNKEEDDITLNQKMIEPDIFSMKTNYVRKNNDIYLNDNMIDDCNIIINQSIIQYNAYDNVKRTSTVSFIPGDIIPSFKNKNDHNISNIYKKSKNRKVSYVSFY
jgi:hypothetical protein